MTVIELFFEFNIFMTKFNLIIILLVLVVFPFCKKEKSLKKKGRSEVTQPETNPQTEPVSANPAGEGEKQKLSTIFGKDLLCYYGGSDPVRLQFSSDRVSLSFNKKDKPSKYVLDLENDVFKTDSGTYFLTKKGGYIAFVDKVSKEPLDFEECSPFTEEKFKFALEKQNKEMNSDGMGDD